MRDVIEDLLKRYFSIRMILRRTIINQRQTDVTVTVIDDLAPNMWGLYEQGSVNTVTGQGKLDIRTAEYIQEQERTRIAKQVFEMALVIIKQQSSKSGRNISKEWNELYADVAPKGNEGHHVLINYSVGALFFMEVLTPFEYDVMEPAFDESGHLMYMKLLPKKHRGDVEEAMGALEVQNEMRKM